MVYQPYQQQIHQAHVDARLKAMSDTLVSAVFDQIEICILAVIIILDPLPDPTQKIVLIGILTACPLMTFIRVRRIAKLLRG